MPIFSILVQEGVEARIQRFLTQRARSTPRPKDTQMIGQKTCHLDGECCIFFIPKRKMRGKGLAQNR